MKIKVSVPATSANVGSGFDALGLAVTLYNTVTFEESDKLDISAADGTRIPRNESNLVYRSAKGLFDKVGKKIPPRSEERRVGKECRSRWSPYH